MILLAGNYCHDLIIGEDSEETRTLGGSVAYAAAILDAFGEPFAVGLALGIAGEVPLPVLQRMREICAVVLADAQSLLRRIGPRGEVLLGPLDERAVPQLDWLKASRSEAALLDLAALRRRVRVVVTDGLCGSTLFDADGEAHVQAEPATERDPTGAGDCFLAGFALGLSRGYAPAQAAALGSFCGARAVEHVGVPRLSRADLQRARSIWT